MSISQKLSDIRNIKADIRQAIIDSGTAVSADEPLSGYAAKIGAISTVPSGTLSITSNGTYNVTKYASCVVECGTLYLKRDIDNGVFKIPTTSFTFSIPSNVTTTSAYAMQYAFLNCTGITSVDLVNLNDGSSYAMQSAFQGCTNLTSVNLSSLTTVNGGSAMQSAFSDCTKLAGELDLSSLTTVGGSCAMQYAFKCCTSLTSVDLSSLTTVSGGSAMYDTFAGCTSLTSVDLSSLTTVSGYRAMYYAFASCVNLTSVDLSSLTTVSGGQGMQSAFSGCTKLKTLSFPKLKNFHPQDTSQFTSMCSGCTDIELHFRFDMEDKVKALTGYSATTPFGASSGTVLFDLSRAELAFHVDSESTVSIYIDGELQS